MLRGCIPSYNGLEGETPVVLPKYTKEEDSTASVKSLSISG